MSIICVAEVIEPVSIHLWPMIQGCKQYDTFTFSRIHVKHMDNVK